MKTGWEERAEKCHCFGQDWLWKTGEIDLPRKQEFQEVMSKRNHRALESESTGFSPSPVSHQLHNPADGLRVKKQCPQRAPRKTEFI